MPIEYRNQEIQYYRNPNVIAIPNFFGKEMSKIFLKHIIDNKNNFGKASVGGGKVARIDNNMRSNQVLFLSEKFPDMNESILGQSMMAAIRSTFLHELATSSFLPLSILDQTDYSDIQISRYGDGGQHYDWHIDHMGGDSSRLLTFVYYFFKEPKKFKGGEVEFTDGLIANGKLLNQTPEPKIITLQPKNDMLVMFGAKTPHRVKKTISSKTFSDGRFSVNMWIGKR